MKRLLKIILAGSLVFMMIFCFLAFGGFILLRQSPSTAAQGADYLRGILGDKAVANLEMLLFRIEDQVERAQLAVGIAEPEAPWQVEEQVASPAMEVAVVPTEITQPTLTATYTRSPSGEIQSTTAPEAALIASPTALVPSATPTPTSWAPRPMQASGNLEGEGVWSPYIQDASGRIVAYRAFLQPDPERPYSVVAVVAFDLDHIRLYFVLGFEEPYNPEAPDRSGKMPEEHKQPGLLLAAFNGGFKAQHGGSGAMSEGIVVLPPREGLGTVAMYSDGSVRLGEWGSEIIETQDLLAWRQNGPLVVQDGEINPRIFNSDPKDWGYTVDDVSPTLRSGMGISEDEGTLYYFAGPKLTMEALAMSMLSGGAANGIQLDINNYWVHFVVYPADRNELIAEPLLPELMIENFDRYLRPFGRDYFYITSTEGNK